MKVAGFEWEFLMSEERQYMFGPGSMMWKVNRESVLLLGGRSALLMQLAHPLVAAGVADHSEFEAEPLKRLRRTLEATTAVVFGDVRTAKASVDQINAVHSSVNGTAPDGTRYSALDPQLLLWVHSTLTNAAITVYESCFGSLEEDEVGRYYEETKVFAGLFGIPETIIPPSLTAMRDWMTEKITRGEVRVGDQARELAEPILHPLRLMPRRFARSSAFVTAALLPEPIREGYGLKVGRAGRAMLNLGGRTSRVVLPRVPSRVRNFPLFVAGPAVKES
jgi:uncharacterized protein (DUF2236 family)